MYELVEVEDLHELEQGTHIAVRRVFENINLLLKLKVFRRIVSDRDYYYHHGVLMHDVPRNRGSSQVIHFYGQTTNDAEPCLIDIDQFKQRAADGKLYIARYNDPVLPVEKTLRRANYELHGAHA